MRRDGAQTILWSAACVPLTLVLGYVALVCAMITVSDGPLAAPVAIAAATLLGAALRRLWRLSAPGWRPRTAAFAGPALVAALLGLWLVVNIVAMLGAD